MNLAVITSYANPFRSNEKRRNFLRFVRQIEAAGVPVFVAELAYDSEPWVIP